MEERNKGLTLLLELYIFMSMDGWKNYCNSSLKYSLKQLFLKFWGWYALTFYASPIYVWWQLCADNCYFFQICPLFIAKEIKLNFLRLNMYTQKLLDIVCVSIICFLHPFQGIPKERCGCKLSSPIWLDSNSFSRC